MQDIHRGIDSVLLVVEQTIAPQTVVDAESVNDILHELSPREIALLALAQCAFETDVYTYTIALGVMQSGQLLSAHELVNLDQHGFNREKYRQLTASLAKREHDEPIALSDYTPQEALEVIRAGRERVKYESLRRD